MTDAQILAHVHKLHNDLISAVDQTGVHPMVMVIVARVMVRAGEATMPPTSRERYERLALRAIADINQALLDTEAN